MKGDFLNELYYRDYSYSAVRNRTIEECYKIHDDDVIGEKLFAGSNFNVETMAIINRHIEDFRLFLK